MRSEDGCSIEGTDISAYIDNLPFNVNTRSFSSRDASGSTSMAAGIQELVEVIVIIITEYNFEIILRY